MNLDNFLTGMGRRLFQRLIVMFVIVVALRMVGFFMGPGDDGTFRSTSSEMRAAPAQSNPDEDDLWGTGSTGNKQRRPSRDRDSSGPPVYDPGQDGGWGSN